MVVSVETTLQHPQRGFIKLEDTVVVTDTGFDIYGEGGRGWNRGGTAVRELRNGRPVVRVFGCAASRAGVRALGTPELVGTEGLAGAREGLCTRRAMPRAGSHRPRPSENSDVG